MEKKPKINREVRSVTVNDFSAAEGGKITGHAAVFDTATDIGGYFQEIIARGAFDKCDLTDVPLFKNHDLRGIPLARSRRNNGSSTMTLTIDEKGLRIDATLDTDNNSEAKALYNSIQRGDLDGMSFMFEVKGQKWDNLNTDYPTRTITDIAKVYEVSAVTFPAYKQTDIKISRNKDGSVDTEPSCFYALESAREELSRGLDIKKQKSKLKNKYREVNYL